MEKISFIFLLIHFLNINLVFSCILSEFFWQLRAELSFDIVFCSIAVDGDYCSFSLTNGLRFGIRRLVGRILI